jgi:hypothetical protein
VCRYLTHPLPYTVGHGCASLSCPEAQGIATLAVPHPAFRQLSGGLRGTLPVPPRLPAAHHPRGGEQVPGLRGPGARLCPHPLRPPCLGVARRAKTDVRKTTCLPSPAKDVGFVRPATRKRYNSLEPCLPRPFFFRFPTATSPSPSPRCYGRISATTAICSKTSAVLPMNASGMSCASPWTSRRACPASSGPSFYLYWLITLRLACQIGTLFPVRLTQAWICGTCLL